MVFHWSAVLVSYKGQKEAEGRREGVAEGWPIVASLLVRGVGRNSRIRFCVDNYLADYRCLLCGKEALSNSHPQQWSRCFKAVGQLSITGSVHKKTGCPSARDS